MNTHALGIIENNDGYGLNRGKGEAVDRHGQALAMTDLEMSKQTPVPGHLTF